MNRPVKSTACLLALLGGCHALAFPENTELHQRADYTRGAGAVSYLNRMRTHDGQVDFFQELDEHLGLLRDIVRAERRLEVLEKGARLGARDRRAVAAERARLGEEAEHVARVSREFLDLAAASKLMSALPELDEALRLAEGKEGPPPPGLSPETLGERLRIVGSGPARCGAETPDPMAGPGAPPPFFIMARDSVDELGREVVYPPEVRAKFARIVNASRAQRQAMGQYGVFQSIEPRAGGQRGEVWRFRFGSVERDAAGARPIDYAPRAVLIECEFDRRGQLVGGRETVIREGGKPVRL